MSELSLNIVQAILTNARRLGLMWTLTPATVADPATTDNPMVPVIMDGDDVVINTTSLIGGLAATTRVMVLSVPPAGNYIIGRYGDTSIRRSLVSSIAYKATNNYAFTLVTSTVPGCDVILTVTRESLVRTRIYGQVLASVTGVSFVAIFLFIDNVQRYFSEGTARVAGDRFELTNSESFILAPGTYSIQMRASRSAAAGTQELIGTQTRLILDIFE